MALPEEDPRYQLRQVIQRTFNTLTMDEQGKVLAAILSGQDGGPQVLFECEINHDRTMHPLGQISLSYTQTVKGELFLLVGLNTHEHLREDPE